MHPDTNILEALSGRLLQVGAINAAYLHGSAARGLLRPESDLDLAVLPFAGAELSPETILDLSAKLAMAVGRDVDTGALSTSNLVYAREVATCRVVLFEKDPGPAGLFFATALGEYADLKAARRPVEAAYGT